MVGVPGSTEGAALSAPAGGPRASVKVGPGMGTAALG